MTSQITTFEEMQARLSKLEEQVRQMEKVVEARALHIVNDKGMMCGWFDAKGVSVGDPKGDHVRFGPGYIDVGNANGDLASLNAKSLMNSLNSPSVSGSAECQWGSCDFTTRTGRRGESQWVNSWPLPISHCDWYKISVRSWLASIPPIPGYKWDRENEIFGIFEIQGYRAFSFPSLDTTTSLIVPSRHEKISPRNYQENIS